MTNNLDINIFHKNYSYPTQSQKHPLTLNHRKKIKRCLAFTFAWSPPTKDPIPLRCLQGQGVHAWVDPIPPSTHPLITTILKGPLACICRKVTTKLWTGENRVTYGRGVLLGAKVWSDCLPVTFLLGFLVVLFDKRTIGKLLVVRWNGSSSYEASIKNILFMYKKNIIRRQEFSQEAF